MRGWVHVGEALVILQIGRHEDDIVESHVTMDQPSIVYPLNCTQDIAKTVTDMRRAPELSHPEWLADWHRDKFPMLEIFVDQGR